MVAPHTPIASTTLGTTYLFSKPYHVGLVIGTVVLGCRSENRSLWFEQELPQNQVQQMYHYATHATTIPSLARTLAKPDYHIGSKLTLS